MQSALRCPQADAGSLPSRPMVFLGDPLGSPSRRARTTVAWHTPVSAAIARLDLAAGRQRENDVGITLTRPA